MKTLWESLLDTDVDLKKTLDENIPYVKFAECFHEVFGEPDRTGLETSHDDHVGRIDPDRYKTDNLDEIIKLLKRDIRKFFSLIKKELKGAKCEYKTKVDKISGLLYNVVISIYVKTQDFAWLGIWLEIKTKEFGGNREVKKVDIHTIEPKIRQYL